MQGVSGWSLPCMQTAPCVLSFITAPLEPLEEHYIGELYVYRPAVHLCLPARVDSRHVDAFLDDFNWITWRLGAAADCNQGYCQHLQ